MLSQTIWSYDLIIYDDEKSRYKDKSYKPNILGFVYGEIYKESRRIICEEETMNDDSRMEWLIVNE